MKQGSLTPRMSAALLALSDFHYLMPRQFARLPGFPPNPEAVHKLLRRFPSVNSELDCVRAGVDREGGRGRIPRLYYLTKAGAEHVAEVRQIATESVFYPKGDKLPVMDVPHRALTIDFRIELNKFAAATSSEVEFFHPYYRTSGANRGSKPADRLRKLSRLDFPPALAERYQKPFIIPDACFVLRTPQKRILCLLEACRGIDTGRVMRQLDWHLIALEHGLASLKYGMETGNLILLVFETESAMGCVLQELLKLQGIEELSGFVACSTIDRLRVNFQDWWYVYGGEIRAGGLY